MRFPARGPCGSRTTAVVIGGVLVGHVSEPRSAGRQPPGANELVQHQLKVARTRRSRDLRLGFCRSILGGPRAPETGWKP